MFDISESAIHVVGAETRSTVSDIDKTIAGSLRWAANAIDGVAGAGVPVAQTNRLYQSFHGVFSKLLEGRKEVAAAVRQLQVIHKHSNQAETDAGCPRHFVTEIFITGEAADADVVAASNHDTVPAG